MKFARAKGLPTTVRCPRKEGRWIGWTGSAPIKLLGMYWINWEAGYGTFKALGTNFERATFVDAAIVKRKG